MSTSEIPELELNGTATARLLLPALRLPAGVSDEQHEFNRAVLQYIQMREGQAGAAQERVITVRDAESLGLTLPGSRGRNPDAAAASAQGALALNGAGVSQADLEQFAASIFGTRVYQSLMLGVDNPERFNELHESLRAILTQDISAEASRRGAAIREVSEVARTGTEALAMRMHEVTAGIRKAAAGVRVMAATAAREGRAVATQVTQVQARLDNFDAGGATVEEVLLAVADAIDGLLAQWTMKVSAGGAYAGIGLAADAPVAGPATSAMIFVADRFAFVKPTDVIGTGAGQVDPLNPGAARIPFGIDADGTIYLNGQVRINTGGAAIESIAKRLMVTTDGQTFKQNTAGAWDVATRTLTASKFNGLTGAVAWSLVSGTYTGSLAGTGGAGTAAGTLSVARASMTSDTVTFRATVTVGGVAYTDDMTIAKLVDGAVGADAISGFLTNEAHSVPASAAGAVSSWAGAAGDFKVYSGVSEVGSGIVFSILDNPDALVATINAATGLYSVTGPGSWAANDSVTTITFRATYGGATLDKVLTITKAVTGATGATGAASITGYLTNESQVVPTLFDGSGGVYANAGGTFKVFDGTAAAAGVAFSIGVAASAGLTAAIHATTGVYTASLAAGTDSGTVTFRATYAGVTIDKTYTIAKSKGGAAGESAPLIALTSDRQAITFNGADVAAPATQTTNLTINRQNIATGGSWLITDGNGVPYGPTTNVSDATATGLAVTVAHFNLARGTTNSIGVTIRVPNRSYLLDQSLLENGWTASNATLSATVDGIATWTTTAANPTLGRAFPGGSRPMGSELKFCRIRARRVSGTSPWEGRLYYSNANHGNVSGFCFETPQVTTSLASFHFIDFDLRTLAVGDYADYRDNLVIGFRLDLVSDTGDVWEIDYIQFYGEVLSDTVSIVRVTDGAVGTRGTIHATGTASAWSDATANSAITAFAGSATRIVGDQVTLSNGSTYAETRYWDGAAWATMGVVLNGNLLVNGSVAALALGVTQLSAITANMGTLTAGVIRNSTDSVNMNMNATGTALVLRAGASTNYGAYAGTHYPVEIRANGAAFFGRGAVSGGSLKASGSYAIPDTQRPGVVFSTAPADNAGGDA